ncbi:hypothetical protein D9M68_224150 [compost metagenome]
MLRVLARQSANFVKYVKRYRRKYFPSRDHTSGNNHPNELNNLTFNPKELVGQF